MFGLNTYFVDHIDKIAQAMDKANYKNIGHAAASLRKRVIESVKDSPYPSRPGRPPQTRRGALRRAVVYKVDADGLSAIIGARYSRFGDTAKYHEFGGLDDRKDYSGRRFPARPFMGPALDDSAPRFAAEWSSSIGAP